MLLSNHIMHLHEYSLKGWWFNIHVNPDILHLLFQMLNEISKLFQTQFYHLQFALEDLQKYSRKSKLKGPIFIFVFIHIS